MRAVSRVASVSINTVTKLLTEAGTAYSAYMDKAMRALTVTDIQVDEISAFIGAKQKNVPAHADPAMGLGLGDYYTFTPIIRAMKLMPCYMLNYLVDEAGIGAVDTMRAIKRALDPLNILNPGKVVGW